MKTVLATTVFGDECQKISLLTHPSLKAYAKKIGADFLVLPNADITPLAEYDRIILVHSDIIIRPDTPSLFQVVPQGWIGAFNTSETHTPELTLYAQESGLPYCSSWENRWYNRGVIVVDREQLNDIWLATENSFNYWLNRWNNPDHILDLGPRFNRMLSFDPMANGYCRFDFYIIHYAGVPRQNLEQLIPNDLEIWESLKETNYHIARPVLVRVGGGLGDQICAEPVIREMRRLHPNDHLVVESHWPELWQDLKGYSVDAAVWTGSAERILTQDTLVYLTYGNATNTIPLGGLTHSNMSSTDLSSYLALTRPLPPEKRDIRLGFTSETEASMLKKLGCTKEWLKDAIVLHPGLTWATRTLPDKVWKDVIKGLLDQHKKVVVIGQGGEYQGPRRGNEIIGVLDLELPIGVIDARSKLTVKETLALLSNAAVLISNDSAPIHLAGATDIFILGLFTTKHSHFVLPYRHGSPWYRAAEINLRPSCWPCGVDALRAFPEGLRVDLCKNYDTPYYCHPTGSQILKKLKETLDGKI